SAPSSTRSTARTSATSTSSTCATRWPRPTSWWRTASSAPRTSAISRSPTPCICGARRIRASSKVRRWPRPPPRSWRAGVLLSHHDLLTAIAVSIISAAALALLARRVGQPLLLGYVVGGALLGPHVGLRVVTDEAAIELISEIGLLLLLF